MYSEKDFFGDPLWPAELESQKLKISKSTESESIPNIKLPIIQESQQNSMSQEGLLSFQEESYDLQRTLFQFQQKMQYSNLKHSEVTYLDDFQKHHIFNQENEQNPQKQNQKNKLEFESRIQQILVKFQEEQPLYDQYSQGQYSDQNYVPQRILSIVDKYIIEKQKKKPKKHLYRRSIFKEKKIPINQAQQRKQNLMIQQLLDEKCLMGNAQKKRKMLKVENQIIRKLKYQQQSINQKEEINDQNEKKVKKSSKFLKYKILTQAQKQYLVFLTTLSTTCQVSRRFNISVNNICRWKKGCARKVGAGRKITNQELQQKVIQYVKDLVRKNQPLTRKKVQIKAKQLSEDNNFKASKGWFERFYTRNINIFPSQQTDEKYWNER